MQLVEVKCPVCKGTDISKNGKSRNDVQRYICNEPICGGKSFMLEYSYNGCKPGVDRKIIDMTANASGINDIKRVLEVSKGKVSSTLKKQKK
jgi:transposase-like protein